MRTSCALFERPSRCGLVFSLSRRAPAICNIKQTSFFMSFVGTPDKPPQRRAWRTERHHGLVRARFEASEGILGHAVCKACLEGLSLVRGLYKDHQRSRFCSIRREILLGLAGGPGGSQASNVRKVHFGLFNA